MTHLILATLLASTPAADYSGGYDKKVSVSFSGGYDKPAKQAPLEPTAAEPVGDLPPLTTTYLLPNGRLVVVPASQPLPGNLWEPVPQQMPSTCPGGVCPPPQYTPQRRGLFR